MIQDMEEYHDRMADYNDETDLDWLLNENSEYVKDYVLDNLSDSDIESFRKEIAVDNNFMSILTNSRFKEVSFIRKKDGSIFLKGIITYSPKKVKLVDLVKKYPYSNIETVVHKGKVTGYVVTEKIILQNNE